ncbi:PH domain-containing protein [Afipia sp. DC4300-2b1]|uniref:PH domain-containing protein n=1 Tax=Afipia sp. DC4300-2b1 TaxID=2804672 RepID=UPI003CF47267
MTSDTIRQEIATGERVLWNKKALGGLRLEAGDLQKSGFGLLFFGFSLFWIYGAWNDASNAKASLFPLLGLPFALVGFYLFVGHFFWTALCRRYTEYAVTNQRVIVSSGIFSRATQSIEYLKIPVLTMIEKSDGSGSIQFGETKSVNQGDGVSFVATKIDAVPEVRAVYNLLRKTSHSSNKSELTNA